MASGRALARVEALTVRSARGEPLLSDISFELELPARLAVMGRNGAGKSLLVSALAGVTPYDGLCDLPAPRGAVLQDPSGVFVSSSVREEVAFGLSCHAFDPAGIDGRIDAVLRALGVAHLSERDPASLSGGEQQRVHLAAALAIEPGALLLDEPTEYLDSAEAQRLLHAIESLAPAPALVVHATHDAEHALAADALLLLEAGRVAAFGAPADVLRAVPVNAPGIEPPAALVVARRLAAYGLVAPPLPLNLPALERALDRALDREARGDASA